MRRDAVLSHVAQRYVRSLLIEAMAPHARVASESRYRDVAATKGSVLVTGGGPPR